MPPKVKITREEILAVAVDLVRRTGEEAINARTLAGALGCSTQPIFSNFASMEEVKTAVLEECKKVYAAYIKNESESGKWPPYKAFGMAYIRFAMEEKEMFRLLFMRDRSHETENAEESLDDVYAILQKNLDVSIEEARLVHLEMWVCVHGIATLFITSYQKMSEELVSLVITDVYNGIRAKYVKENGNGSC